jgi:hypothetical protein
MTKADDRHAKGTKKDSKLTKRGATLDQPKGVGGVASRGGGPDKAKGANDDYKGGGPDKAKDAQVKSKKTAASRTKRKKTAGVPVER